MLGLMGVLRSSPFTISCSFDGTGVAEPREAMCFATQRGTLSIGCISAVCELFYLTHIMQACIFGDP